ncbi:MAG: phosphoadenosine phosphosulfate reductase family protein, partial [Christensenellaceae bacterium]|nr:phosphoadenosine phosphosulfate reductase family protein [Christensenellaceae bacterium]
MYDYQWTNKNGIYRLIPQNKLRLEIRPVFKEELDYFEFNAYWKYPDTTAPLLWAEGIKKYILNGVEVARAKDGSIYKKPVIDFKQKSLSLDAIDIRQLWDENERLMCGLEDVAITYIRSIHDEYLTKGFKFVLAFSGGKDSLVLLDLVAKALRPDEFVVIFSNTGMELNVTLEAVERAKTRYSKLRFFEASSHLTPDQTWERFGPPGRRNRWCCAVHKSVPTILALRSSDITGDYNAKAVVFDGVRKAESSARSTYELVSEGVKNINQVNCSPILDWETAEIYLYLLKNEILFNDAYRLGLFRVGCKVCPLASAWWESITNDKYPNEIAPLLKRVESYAKNAKPEKEQRKYINSGGWKGRLGGRELDNGGNRITEEIENDRLIFRFAFQSNSWINVAKLLGEIVEKSDNKYTQLINHQSFTFTVDEKHVIYDRYSAMDRSVISDLRGIAHKVAYCAGCKACVVQCPTGAFEITEDQKILIREELCIHCVNCIKFTVTKGCLVAKSICTTGGCGMDLKGMNRYQHFGFRKQWLEHFFEYGTACFEKGQLGTRQYDALKIWLREAELIMPYGKGERS